MAHDIDDGAPRPKRHTPMREYEWEAAPRRPSRSASRRESKLRRLLLSGKAVADEEPSSWRESHTRARSPDYMQDHALVRSGHSERSPPHHYNPTHGQAEFPPAITSGRPGKGAFANKKNKKGDQPFNGGTKQASSLSHPRAPPSVDAPATAATHTVAVVCFNCGVEGRYQVDCKQPPACHKSKSDAHPALMFPEGGLHDDMLLYGHMLVDFGYYQMEISTTPPTSSLCALISVLGGRTASPSIITVKLQDLFRPD
ncbi:hypothetical protein ZWY2020_025755 [Hordeum vulgare]|nr:hypothetical protein ZWY2020_025755 [Hordeum vulgare]